MSTRLGRLLAPKGSLLIVRFFPILLLIACLAAAPLPAFAQSGSEPNFANIVRPPQSDDAEGVVRDEEGEDKGKDDEEKEECKEGEHACRVNRRVAKIENIIEETRETQQSKDIWELPGKEKDLHGARKVGYYIAAVPTTYLFRFITWPTAIFADYLIKKGAVRKVIDVISNKERTFWIYPRLELGFGNGFGGGIGMRHYDLFDRNYQFFANYLVYLNLDQSGGFGIEKPDLTTVAGMPIGFRFETQLQHNKDSEFYGIGIGSSKSNESKYQIDSIYTLSTATFEPYRNLVFNVGFAFLADQTGPGESPSVQTIFPMSQLPGFNRDISYFIPGISVLHDTRDATARPEKGGVRRGVFARFEGLGVEGLDFNLYMIELEQFIRLWLPRHVLALRTAWQYRQPTGGGEVPFFHLSRIDVYSPVRGFGWGRFRDRGSMVFNVEYRFPVWEYMDGELFFDAGRVFHTMSDISFKHMKFTGGGGIRVGTKDYFLFRMSLAYGGEGVKFLFKTSQAF